jgi:hypothetical protein
MNVAEGDIEAVFALQPVPKPSAVRAVSAIKVALTAAMITADLVDSAGFAAGFDEPNFGVLAVMENLTQDSEFAIAGVCNHLFVGFLVHRDCEFHFVLQLALDVPSCTYQLYHTERFVSSMYVLLLQM